MSNGQNKSVETYEASVKAYAWSISRSIDDYLELLTANEKDISFLLDWGTHLPTLDITSESLHQSDDVGKAIADSINKTNIEDIVDNIQTDLLSAIVNNQSAILVKSCMRKVDSYVSQYDIQQENIDNYKVRYFMGITLIEFLEGTRYNTHPRVLRGIANLMLLNVMDFTLREDENNSGIPIDMFHKFQICLLAKKGRGFKETFGVHGLYLIFKTLSKSFAQEKLT